jgi:arylsulfatase A-like enzyme
VADENILLITVDSLRADRVPGGDPTLAPCVTSLADCGCAFTQAVSNGPNTTASFPSILTGSHSLTYGPYGILDPATSPFLAESLLEVGYETVGYHSNPYLGNEQNYDHGFSVYNDLVEGPKSVTTLKDRVERMVDSNSLFHSLLRRVWHTFSTVTNTRSYAQAASIADNAVKWLDQRESTDPFFMWLHFMDVHYPFDPPDHVFKQLSFNPPSRHRIVNLNGKVQERPDELEDADIRTLKQLYDAEVRYTDEQIGRVLDSINTEETIVAFTADHGEAFGEHGRFGHHVYPYDELLRVPLIINGSSIANRTVERQVQLLDLAPTILDVVGIKPPGKMEGRSFAGLLTGNEEADPERASISISENGDTFGVRTSKWKYIRRPIANERLLFDLEADPSEIKDVGSSHSNVVEELDDIVQSYEKSVNIETADINRSDRAKERLQRLGYVE